MWTATAAAAVSVHALAPHNVPPGKTGPNADGSRSTPAGAKIVTAYTAGGAFSHVVAWARQRGARPPCAGANARRHAPKAAEQAARWRRSFTMRAPVG